MIICIKYIVYLGYCEIEFSLTRRYLQNDRKEIFGMKPRATAGLAQASKPTRRNIPKIGRLDQKPQNLPFLQMAENKYIHGQHLSFRKRTTTVHETLSPSCSFQVIQRQQLSCFNHPVRIKALKKGFPLQF